MATVAYIRVSTIKQDEAAQKLAITKFAESNGFTINRWQSVEVSSRKTTAERGIDALIVSLTKGDTLIVSEISRLARSVGEIASICDRLLQRRVRLICIKENIDLVRNGKDIDIQSQVMITMFSLFAQIERTIISVRTKEGMAAAKARGAKIGNPELSKINTDKQAAADEFAKTLEPTIRKMIARGKTQRDIADCLNTKGIPAPRGGKWSQAQVWKVFKRLFGPSTKHKWVPPSVPGYAECSLCGTIRVHRKRYELDGKTYKNAPQCNTERRQMDPHASAEGD